MLGVARLRSQVLVGLRESLVQLARADQAVDLCVVVGLGVYRCHPQGGADRHGDSQATPETGASGVGRERWERSAIHSV